MTRELRKILFVDDDEDVHFIVSLSLREIPNLELRDATSGDEAIRIALEFKPDLILLDVMMPGMDGIAVLKAIRLLPTIASTPIAFLTAKAQKNEINGYRDYDIIDVFMKPFNPTTFSQEILRAWEKFQGKEH